MNQQAVASWFHKRNISYKTPEEEDEVGGCLPPPLLYPLIMGKTVCGSSKKL